MTSKGIQDQQIPHQGGLGGGIHAADRSKASKPIFVAEKQARAVPGQSSIKKSSSYDIKLTAAIVGIILFFAATNIIAGWNLFGAFTTLIIASYSIFCLLSNRIE